MQAIELTLLEVLPHQVSLVMLQCLVKPPSYAIDGQAVSRYLFLPCFSLYIFICHMHQVGYSYYIFMIFYHFSYTRDKYRRSEFQQVLIQPDISFHDDIREIYMPRHC